MHEAEVTFADGRKRTVPATVNGGLLRMTVEPRDLIGATITFTADRAEVLDKVIVDGSRQRHQISLDYAQSMRPGDTVDITVRGGPDWPSPIVDPPLSPEEIEQAIESIRRAV